MIWQRLELLRLEPDADPGWREMTFPAYRHLLDLEPSVRHPEQGDPHRIQPVAVGLKLDARPVGLGLAEISLDGTGRAELLSIFVAPDLRSRGLGRALVSACEQLLAAMGARELQAVWTAGKASSEAVERILARLGWTPPVIRTVTVRFQPARMLTLPILSDRYLQALDRGFSIDSWESVSPEELGALRASNETAPWVTPGLEPWSYRGGQDFDPATSVVARKQGRIVGWVLNQPIDARRLRFAVSFLERRWSRRGGILPLYRESLERAVRAGYELCLFVTPARYPSMIRFIGKWISRRSEFVGETRSARKLLAGVEPASAQGLA